MLDGARKRRLCVHLSCVLAATGSAPGVAEYISKYST
jgi:hypothetical protein